MFQESSRVKMKGVICFYYVVVYLLFSLLNLCVQVGPHYQSISAHLLLASETAWLGLLAAKLPGECV